MKRTRKMACGALPKLRRFGQIEFWWDEHHRFNAIVVECDDPNYPVIASFRYNSRSEYAACKATALSLLERIKKGRVDYRRLARRVPQQFQWDRTYVGNRG